MPVKKATRSTRSTRTTKASSKSSSSDAVLDENIDAPSEITDVKKKPTKSTAAPKKVLGERNAPNDRASSPSPKESSAETDTKKSSKPKKSSKKAATEQFTEVDLRATTPVPSSPTKKRLPEEQVQAFLQNYDLEAQARIARLRASLEVSIQSSITRMRLAIDRIPRAVRELSLADFIDVYGADIHAFMNRAPVQHLTDTQEEWDVIREERSPAKAKRSKTAEVVGKVERTAKGSRAVITSRSAATAAAAAAAAKKKPARSAARAADRSSSAIPTSPSSRPAPSLAAFQPELPTQTPKPRMARPGEVIQWQSINGSPICGVIGPDGRVMPVSFP